MTLLEGTGAVGNEEDGLHHMLAHIGDQADEAGQGQHQADKAHQLHLENEGVQLFQARVIGRSLQLHHLIQLAHQGVDVGKDGLVIVVLRLDGIGFQLLQHLDGGLVDLLM